MHLSLIEPHKKIDSWNLVRFPYRESLVYAGIAFVKVVAETEFVHKSEPTFH